MYRGIYTTIRVLLKGIPGSTQSSEVMALVQTLYFILSAITLLLVLNISLVLTNNKIDDAISHFQDFHSKGRDTLLHGQ